MTDPHKSKEPKEQRVKTINNRVSPHVDPTDSEGMLCKGRNKLRHFKFPKRAWLGE